MKRLNAVLLLIALLAMLSCSDRVTTIPIADANVRASLHQIGGCGGRELMKTAASDSCFSYEFLDNLVVEFCLPGNCCPDTDRFVLNHELHGDTIVVAAVDTAAHLCRCICNYVIHAEFTGLERDRYLFFCSYDEAIVYAEPVER